MNLILDIGNTLTKLAVYNRGKEIFYKKYEKLTQNDLFTIAQKNPAIQHVMVSSVKEEPIIDQLTTLYTNVYILNKETPLPITINYDTPETLGNDRIAAAVGANFLFPDNNNLVIDTGTALTIDFVDKKGIYLGGNISPGLDTRYKALHQFTGRLPLVRYTGNVSLTGKSTNQAIQSGAWFGMIYEILGYIKDYETAYGEIKILMTGGDANYFVEKLKNSIFVVFNLNMIGLNRILDYNVVKN